MRNTVPFSFFIALLLLATAGTATAQNFGVRAGVVSSNVNFIIEDSNVDIKPDRATNLAIGLFVELPFGENLAIQPELNYLGRGANFDDTAFGGSELRLSYLDLGALVKLRLNADAPVGFYLGAGPFLGYAVSGKEGDRDINFDEDGYKRTDFSLAGAAGVTFGSSLRFFGEFRYSYGLSNLDDEGDADFKLRNNAILLTGGVMVPLGN